MSTPSTLSHQDVQVILAKWKTDGPTPEEQDQFMEAAIKDLQDPEKAKGYQANIEQVGVWANDVDASFDKVTRGLQGMVNKFGSKFPELAGFRDQWNGYNLRWVTHLLLSRDVASEQVSILRRFDQVFLEMVQTIVTDQDREDAIIELQDFIDEDHGNSDKMAQGFFSLQKDIEAFVVRFDEYCEDKEEELKDQALELRITINGIQSTIQSLNWAIAGAVVALAGALASAATVIGLLGVVTAEVALLILLGQRLQAELDLQKAQRDLALVNEKQEALAQIMTQFDGLRPDITLICEKLKLFGDIWQSIRSDSIRFQEQLKRGMGAVSDERFQREIRLARSMCKPMQNGLEKYASVLENRTRKRGMARRA